MQTSAATHTPPPHQTIEVTFQALHTLSTAAAFAGISRETLKLYHSEGLVKEVGFGPQRDPLFNDDGLRQVRRIEHLRLRCGINLDGLRLMIGLMDEVEELHETLRQRR